VEATLGGSTWRAALLVGLRDALGRLAKAGCQTVDPSLLDPVFFDFSANRKGQKMRFGGELFPAEATADLAGTGFLEYFQRDRRTGRPKGILELDLRELP